MDLVRAVVCAILVYFQIGGTLLYRCNTCHGNTATLLMVTVGSPASQGGDALQVILSASIASHMAVNIESYIRWQWWWLLRYKDKKLLRNLRSYAGRYFVAVHRIVHPMHGDILWSMFGQNLVIFCGRYFLKPQWLPCIWEMVAHGSMGGGSSSTDGEGPHFTQKWVPIFTKLVNLVWRIFKKS